MCIEIISYFSNIGHIVSVFIVRVFTNGSITYLAQIVIKRGGKIKHITQELDALPTR
jgi:bifunctional DNase/RNase